MKKKITKKDIREIKKRIQKIIKPHYLKRSKLSGDIYKRGNKKNSLTIINIDFNVWYDKNKVGISIDLTDEELWDLKNLIVRYTFTDNGLDFKKSFKRFTI